MSVDKAGGTVTILPLNPKGKQTLKVDAKTVVVGQGSGTLETLAPEQQVTAYYDPETRQASRIRVVIAPAGDATRRTVMRPAFPTTPRIAPQDGGNSRYVLRVQPAKTIEATLDYEMKFPSISANQWVVVAPAPPELPGQTDVQNLLEPRGTPSQEMSPTHRSMLTALVPADGWEQRYQISAKAEYRATLMSRRLALRDAGEQGTEPNPPRPEERRAALVQSKTYDFDSPGFRKWLDSQSLRRDPQEGQVDYARRVFQAIKQGFSYEFTDRMDRRASHICAAGKSDCGGLSIVFASALRAQGIPARILVGRWAMSAQGGRGEYYQAHVKAEFYADGVGWVPADLASGRLHDRSREGLRYFGRDEGDFLTLHLDPDLVVDSVLFGPQPVFCVNGGLLVWVQGDGSASRPKIRQGWHVREVPLSSRSLSRNPEGAFFTGR